MRARLTRDGSSNPPCQSQGMSLTVGVPHIPKSEKKMRWPTAPMSPPQSIGHGGGGGGAQSLSDSVLDLVQWLQREATCQGVFYASWHLRHHGHHGHGGGVGGIF